MSGSIEWTDVKPGMVVMGSANRSILFGGIGPRHEVSIGYRFKIARLPVPPSEALKIIQSSEADIASERDRYPALGKCDQIRLDEDSQL